MQLAYVFLGYFLGSMLFGYRITWLLKGVDIRKLAEDENPGTYNAFVFGGFWCGIRPVVQRIWVVTILNK